jgi:hypothetical protein
VTGISSWSEYEWSTFLKDWNEEFLREIDLAQVDRAELVEVYSEFARPLETGWLGEKAATCDQIASVEARLSITFPLDYVAFLRVSNGWVAPGFGSYSRMIDPIEEVELYSRKSPDALQVFIEGGELYFLSGKVEGNRSTDFLNRTVALCEQGQSTVILFDPDAAARSFWLAEFHDRSRAFASFTDLVLYERQFCKESFSQVLASFKFSPRHPNIPRS